MPVRRGGDAACAALPAGTAPDRAASPGRLPAHSPRDACQKIPTRRRAVGLLRRAGRQAQSVRAPAARPCDDTDAAQQWNEAAALSKRTCGAWGY